MPLALLVLSTVMAVLHFAEGGARLLEPPMRSSYWREIVAPPNFNDEELNCGGFDYQWQTANGKCGSCGDKFFGDRENESPGKYSTFPPQRTYLEGSRINATVFTRPNMLGWFEFRLCTQQDGPGVDLPSCLDQNVLQIEETGSTRFYPGSVGGYYDMHVIIPQGLTCEHCILQWKYNTGYRQNPNVACPDCVGCGQQEQFYNCADIRINPSNTTSNISTTTPAPVQTTTTTTLSPTPTTTVSGVTTTTAPSGSLQPCTPSSKIVRCEAKGIHRLVPGMEQWCLKNCLSGKCREEFCFCFCNYPEGFKIKISAAVFNMVSTSPSSPSGTPPSTTNNRLCYKPKPAWRQTPGLEGWCRTFCPSKYCADMCELSLCETSSTTPPLIG